MSQNDKYQYNYILFSSKNANNITIKLSYK